jgi:hypothetical protein
MRPMKDKHTERDQCGKVLAEGNRQHRQRNATPAQNQPAAIARIP